jgi:dienelactone hydrolase
MKKRVLFIVLAVLLALLIVPVLATQLTRPEPKTSTPIELDSLTFEEVRYMNASQGISLAGMLFVPEGEPPFPVVVMITGSGSFSRSNPWYLNYARYLQANGIAVLLPDKRGTESSGGDWRTSSLEDLASDTLSAISYLRTERRQLVGSIGILGVSQGGVIASIVASEDPDLAFAINVVGHVVPMNDQLRYEENYNLRQMGVLPGFSNVISYLSSFVNQKIVDRGWWATVGNFDALPYWQESLMPILVLFGDQDTNVPSVRSQERLNALGKENIQVFMFEGSGHSFVPPEGVAGEYQREDALEMIRDFILGVIEER